MSSILEFITAALGPMGPLIVVGVFGFLLIMVSIPLLLKKGANPYEKLGIKGVGQGFTRASEDTEAPRINLRYDSGKMNLQKFEAFLTPKNEEEFSAARLKLTQAGYRSRGAVGNFNFAKMALGVSFIFFGVVYMLVQGGQPTPSSVVLYVLLPGGVGYYLPTYWVERRRQTRQEEVEHGFPDALDLMLVCVEAGQSLDQSILRVAGEIRGSNVALAEEFEIVSHEMRAGKERVVVLRDMATRCGVTDISSFVTVLIQSASFGTSISDALRVYADEMRDKRVMRAEEKANKLPTKMTLGTMMFTVPPLLIVMVGPSVYDIFQAFGVGK
ncbi:MAG: type II secretion system F family protein [Rhodobacteraceae bacterium]|nr:type II secretion system F family protein [Paracoccaceae bacterium]